MKKALYGTTALVAAGLVAGQASAASGLKLGITGYYRGAIGASNSAIRTNSFPGVVLVAGDGDWGRNNVAFRQEVRVNFTGETTLDNGLTFDVLVGLNAGGGNAGHVECNRQNQPRLHGRQRQVRPDPLRRRELRLSIHVRRRSGQRHGQLRPEQPERNLQQRRPVRIRRHSGSACSCRRRFRGAGTCFGLETRSTKIMYFSPTFGGFNFAVSLRALAYPSAGGSGGTGGTAEHFRLPRLPVGRCQLHPRLRWRDADGRCLGRVGACRARRCHRDNANNLGNKPSMYQGGFQVALRRGSQLARRASMSSTTRMLATAAQTRHRHTTGDDAYMITVGGS